MDAGKRKTKMCLAPPGFRLSGEQLKITSPALSRLGLLHRISEEENQEHAKLLPSRPKLQYIFGVMLFPTTVTVVPPDIGPDEGINEKI